MKEKIRIASGQGFWGDMVDAPFRQITEGPVDYLVMDYLAEVTMSILQKQKLRDPKLGYARDIPPLMERILPIVKDKGIKVITNGGGVNPYSCKDAIIEVAKKLGIKGLKIGIVIGDDILNRIDNLLDSGIELNNMETGESIRTVKDKILSANVYLGAGGVVEALQNGADIIMTGRVTDTGLTLAPMIYEFGWNFSDFNLMATGTVAGHILECGGQASGGNFLGDWKSVPELDKIGFPIAEAHPDGTVFITKHDGTGGIVNVATVSEQLVYEIGDPKDYITPDCIADFTSIQLEESGNNRVKVTGVKGQPATEFYKVSMSYLDGYSAFGSLTYCWPDALDKAQAAEEILRKRLDALGLTFDEIKSEFQGYNACHGPLANTPDDPSEIVLRIGVRSHDKKSVERFGMEIAPLILTGPPGVTGFAGGRPKPSEVVAYWPALIPKSAVKYEVEVFDL
ncbi:MAG: DUF1446 domain-containing protein [Ignavibacteriaceae bacterium]|nr:MAG: DUF1446 domain-containing protein [Chlorobiota bacterium]MBV6397877.1 hypothetical protein [Ignavibacteria bacterium]MCC6886824.1 DUF1446 domain-containing protein [Ignavibacteriales bacterium]MCE7953948.1 DUF1446 domain-containing protein [Chlorobi bacterium CHB7]MEB2330627.1 DUF1446 domain-containing protein [Ignavibacteriaceae bacterium]RIK47553.1 MAG: DUF1446 domain-containing protein [Ignavibacteriota bacterium]